MKFEIAGEALERLKGAMAKARRSAQHFVLIALSRAILEVEKTGRLRVNASVGRPRSRPKKSARWRSEIGDLFLEN